MEELEGLSLPELLRSVPRSDQATRRALARPKPPIAAQGSIQPSWSCPSRSAIRSRSIELSAQPTFNKQGRFIGYHGVGSDVTGARQAADRIAHMARHDALTGLPNRLQLLENLGEALDGARNRGESCAILLIDLDRFKIGQ